MAERIPDLHCETLESCDVDSIMQKALAGERDAEMRDFLCRRGHDDKQQPNVIAIRDMRGDATALRRLKWKNDVILLT